ncbi:Uncharacterised protein [Mycobacteroides abscessus subsp. bolletii]|nr:Uncharacterised protein [Mycobacteroides abscessus subsp. bolletii]
MHNKRFFRKSLTAKSLKEHTWLTTHVTTQITIAMDTRKITIATHLVETVPTVIAVTIVQIVVMTVVVSEGAATMVSAPTEAVMNVVALVTVVLMVSVPSVMTAAVAAMIVMIVAVTASAVRIA